ncbi:hypothetical protein L9F63_026165, partial [Diploptera punctata]
AVFGETSGNYKPHDHGLQPENLHQDHHSNSGRESLREYHGSGPPFCPLCRKSFTRAWSLHRHMADTHFYVPQSFECDVCGRSYRSRNSLVSHKSQYH